jgi:hypothetical protein
MLKMSSRTRASFGAATATIAILFGASQSSAHQPDLERAKARELLNSQMESWNRGDLEGALRTYCPAETATWVNSAGISHGFEAFARSMRSEFGGGTAQMGKLSLELINVRLFGDGSNLMVVRWAITKGATRAMGGISSQLWADCDGKMRVVFEHSS